MIEAVPGWKEGQTGRCPSRRRIRISDSPKVAMSIVLATIAAPASGIVTSDFAGSHVLQDNVPLEVTSSTGFCDQQVPDLDHDSVVQIRFFRPDFGNTFCSGALINTPSGGAALTAAHCVTDTSGTMIATDFTVDVYDAFGILNTFSTSNPFNVKVHPNYDGVGWHGYDLTLIFFDQPIQWPVLLTMYGIARIPLESSSR